MIDFHSLQHCQSCRMQEHPLMNQLTPSQRKEINAANQVFERASILDQDGMAALLDDVVLAAGSEIP
jgi:hypothetical protein